jgi:two-component system response regulator CpxR
VYPLWETCARTLEIASRHRHRGVSNRQQGTANAAPVLTIQRQRVTTVETANTVTKTRRKTMRPRKTILCVDDNEQILSVRKFLLETRGYRVVAVRTAAEALEQLQEAMPGSVDLLLSDLILPQMDGNELARRAKEMHPTLPALLVSGTVTSFERAASADAFLPKGACTPVEMLDRIKILVARKRGPKKQPAAVEAVLVQQVA